MIQKLFGAAVAALVLAPVAGAAEACDKAVCKLQRVPQRSASARRAQRDASKARAGMEWGCPQSQQTGTVPRLYLHLKPPSQALKKPYIMKLTLQSTFLSRAGFAFLATQRRPSGYSIT